ncbi:MAG: transposase family protein [Candidatus Aphodosoma sp.]
MHCVCTTANILVNNKDNLIILHIEAKEREKVCPKCGHRQLVKNGFRIRDSIGLPIGGKEVIISMKDQCYGKSYRNITC